MMDAKMEGGALEFVEAMRRMAMEGDPPVIDETEHTKTLMVPEGLRLERMLLDTPYPARKAAQVRMQTLDSFVAYLKDHEEEGSTAVFAAMDLREGGYYGLWLRGVVDYHHRGRMIPTAPARWADHRVELGMRPGDTTVDWLEHNGKGSSQEFFSEFMLEHAGMVVSPSAAELSEIALALEGSVGCSFRSVMNPDTGSRVLAWNENPEIKGTKPGQVEVPRTIVVALELLESFEPIVVEATIRTRASNGQVTLGWKFHELRRHSRELVEVVIATLRAEGLTVYEGTAEARMPMLLR
jgi:hypothetical protein